MTRAIPRFLIRPAARALALTVALCLVAPPLAAQGRRDDLPTSRGEAKPQVVTALPQFKTLRMTVAEDKQEAQDLNGHGPSVHEEIDLAQELRIDGLGDFDLELSDLLSLSLKVIPDANRESGIYYYLPSRFFLHWDDDIGYHLVVDYKFEREDGKNVVFDARLTPGDVSADVRLLNDLLAVYLRQHPPHPHPLDKIRLLPLPAEVEAEFNWSALDVTDADAMVTGRDRDTGQISLTLSCDVPTRELLLKKLGDSRGLTGQLRVEPQQVTPEVPARATASIDIVLRLADSKSYGRQRWLRGSGADTTLRNDHAFPLRARYLAYLHNSGSALALRGYDLQRARVPARGTARVANERINGQIDETSTLRAVWVYDLEADETAVDDALDDLTDGVFSVPVKNVSIEILGGSQLFETYELHKIVVEARSRFFDPKGEQEVTHVYEFSSQDADLPLAPLYVPEGTDEPLFTYRVAVVTLLGETHQDAEPRTSSTSLVPDVLIGSALLDDLLPQPEPVDTDGDPDTDSETEAE
jgi:hypothetical protein